MRQTIDSTIVSVFMYLPLSDLRQIHITWGTESWAGLPNPLTMPSMLRAVITYLTAFQVSSFIAASQVPAIDGVIGGVPPSSGSAKSGSQPLQLTSFATTPGKLRVTENSGVCGTPSLVSILDIVM